MVKLKSYVLPFAIVMGILFHHYLALAKDVTPFVIFTILLLNYSAVDMKKLKVTRLDWLIAIFQIVVSIGAYFLFKLCGSTEIVAQGVLSGVLCPVAASSVVIACILGANRETMTTYTIMGNLMVTVIAPIYFSFIGIQQDMPILDSMWLIFRMIFPIIALPFFIAFLLQKFAPKVNGFLCKYTGFSFYLWSAALTLTLGQTIDFMFLHGKENIISIIVMGIASIFFCILQFWLGKKMGAKCGDRIAGGQMLGQKNSAMGIWMANTYLLPLASVYCALYSIWQNLFNSWQMWRHERMDKKQMRAYVRQNKVFEDSSSLWNAVESSPEFGQADCVLLYHSLPDEVPTHMFIEKWYGRKKIVLPLVSGSDLLLKEYDPSLMVEGYRGIMEPSAEARDVDPSEIQFAVVPGVAFDKKGNRLGRGKGFYDRLLPRLSCHKTGVAFNCQIFENVPHDNGDVKVDSIVTP